MTGADTLACQFGRQESASGPKTRYFSWFRVENCWHSLCKLACDAHSARRTNLHMPLKSNLLVWALLAPGLTGFAWGASFVAGSAPAQRPVDAPTIKQHQITAESLGKRLHGVTDPLPPNVVDAALAGSWFMPLAHPGMTGPYDIRGWHRTESPSTSPARIQ